MARLYFTRDRSSMLTDIALTHFTSLWIVLASRLGLSFNSPFFKIVALPRIILKLTRSNIDRQR